MIKQFFKIGGVKTEKEFLAKYPTEASFFRQHPEAMALIEQSMPYMPSYSDMIMPQAMYGIDDMTYDEEIPLAQEGVSIVDYLNSRGLNSSKEARSKLAAERNISNYDFSAEKNIELLNLLRKNEKNVKNPSLKKQNSRPQSSRSLPELNQVPYAAAINPKPVENIPNVFPQKQKTRVQNQFINPRSPIKSDIPTKSNNNQRALESGTIVDKGTNTMYVVDKGKIIKNVPVLTGQAGKNKNTDKNSNMYSMSQLDKNPSLRSTPTGTYFMQPVSNIYGWPGYNLNPISAFNQSAPAANDLAMHITYGANPKPGSGLKGHPNSKEFARRNAGYNMPNNRRYFSYGCTNMQGESIDCLQKLFPKGDTAIYLDSRNMADLEFIKKMQNQRKGGGSTYNAGVWFKQGGMPCYECGGSFMDGGDIPNYMQDLTPMYNFGGYFPQAPRFASGGIHIDPSKRGTFTAAATKAGMGVQEFASKVLSAPEGRYSPAMRKKANFARNAAGWKKEEGGIVEGQIIDVTPDMLEQLQMGGYTFEILND